MTIRMNDRRIVLVGFMGCGKTSVAEALAHHLGCEMVDLDSFIIKREGRSPAEIIQQDGESAFRDLESLALRDVLQDRSARIVALGGGTWTIPANRTLVALHECLSVWLDAPFEVCWDHISENREANRPLAPDRDTAEIRYRSRRADYALADERIVANPGESSEIIAKKILAQA
jgi:shikimate kinase